MSETKRTTPPASASEPDAASSKVSRSRWTPGAWIAVLVAIATGIYVANRPEPVDSATTLVPVFEHVEAEGFTANRSLAGRYRPGDVLQVADPAPLARPIVALRGDDCFPDLSPSRSPFPLPEDEAARSASFGLAGAQVSKVFPGLALDDSAAAGYRLVFERPELWTIPKLDLSGNFTAECEAKLDTALAIGDSLDWFVTVHEVVLAEGMTFEVTWERGTSASARAEIETRTTEALEAAAPADPAPSNSALATAISVEMAGSDSRTTTWTVDAPVVLGYRTRPMAREAVSPEDASLEAGAAVSVRPVDAMLAPVALAAGDDDPREAFSDDSDAPFTGRLAIRVQTESGAWQRVSVEHAFSTGDRFRFEVESNRPARLVVFHRPPGGERAELWPADRDDPNRIDRDSTLFVPPRPAAFEMQDETGAETFFVALVDDEAIESGPASAEPREWRYYLRGLDEDATRGVGIADNAEPWLYFEPDAAGDYLAAVGFSLRHDRR